MSDYGIPVKPKRAQRNPWLVIKCEGNSTRIYRMRDSSWRWWWRVLLSDGRYACSVTRTRRDAVYRSNLALVRLLGGER